MRGRIACLVGWGQSDLGILRGSACLPPTGSIKLGKRLPANTLNVARHWHNFISDRSQSTRALPRRERPINPSPESESSSVAGSGIPVDVALNVKSSIIQRVW